MGLTILLRVLAMVDSFEAGYKSSTKSIDGIAGAEIASAYVGSVQKSIEDLTDAINKFSDTGKNVSQLKGDVFEHWHARTFNINASVNGNTDIISKIMGTSEEAIVRGSNRFASSDIDTSWLEKYGLKDFGDAAKSAKEQAKSHFEYYNQNVRLHQMISFEDFCQKHGFNPEDVLNRPIYEGQTRIIPEDQLEGAKEWLKRKILEEQSKRPELVEKYRETLDSITDKIHSPKGTESLPISEKVSRQIADDGKNGNFDAKNYGISTEEYIKFNHIINQALKAGATAAVLAAILKIVPDLIKLIEKAMNREYISGEELKKMGLECLSSSTQSFIKGSVAASITATFKAGLAGEIAKAIDPILIGTATAIALNAISNAIRMAKGQMKLNEFADKCMRDVFVAFFAYGGAVAFQSFIPIPIIGAILGNIIGSIVGTFVYSTCNNLFLSFCIETGYTFLGIVAQDYSLPDEVLTEMGLDVVIYDEGITDDCEPDICNPDVCEPDICNPDIVSTFIIKRGVIGINKIGFMIQ